ncbi:hypothetical protein [Methylobacterium radiodurans]|uniref:hypothetical protein n=1 Tax=Methylobacterium radiodurans TaxID=2202828 RepID=UPI0013A5B71B|nr:hypothetical protein [Methylobacterium radiodurans]
MILVGTLVGMPILMMVVTLAADAVLRAHPSKDDVWRLPKVSSLRAAAPHL